MLRQLPYVLLMEQCNAQGIVVVVVLPYRPWIGQKERHTSSQAIAPDHCCLHQQNAAGSFRPDSIPVYNCKPLNSQLNRLPYCSLLKNDAESCSC